MDKYTSKRGRAGFGQAFEAIGPILAGFQLASVVIGFFGSGALAKWVLENWFPFTRYVWSIALSAIKFPEITAAEKDALTTMVFFVPMGVWALYSKHKHRDEEPSAALRVPALFVGAAFIIILGEQFIRDALKLANALTSVAPVPDGPVIGWLAWVDTGLSPFLPPAAVRFVEFLVFLAICLALGLSLAFFSVLIAPIFAPLIAPLLRHRWTVRFLNFLISIKHKAPIGFRSVGLRLVASAMSAMANVIVGSSALAGALSVFYFDVGPIRSAALILTLLLMLATVYLNPTRLLVSFGVFVMFVICSFGFDLLLLLISVVQNAPKELVVPPKL